MLNKQYSSHSIDPRSIAYPIYMIFGAYTARGRLLTFAIFFDVFTR